MKLLLGMLISFGVGAFCRFFDIPVGSPPVLPGAMLVLSMTLGYAGTSYLLEKRDRPATTSHLCGGPNGATVAAVQKVAQAPNNQAASQAE